MSEFEKLGSLALRDKPSGPTSGLGVHPTINASDVLAGYLADGVNAADLGDNSAGGIEVIAHDVDSCDNRYLMSTASIHDRNIFFCDRRNNGRMQDQNQLRAWLAGKLAEGGRGTAAKLAVFMGLTPIQISRMSATRVGKEVRDIKAHELPRIIEFFGEGPDGEPSPGRQSEEQIRQMRPDLVSGAIIGAVSAGNWREIDDFDQRELPMLTLPSDPDFPNARVLVFTVEGDSMNDLDPVPIRPSAHVVCVAYADIERYYPPRDGMIVVVERRRDGGHLREWSIKQVELHDDRIEFHPRSTNKKHVPIVVPLDAMSDDGVQVEIIALVRNVLFKLG